MMDAAFMRTLADRQEITDLIYRYCRSISSVGRSLRAMRQ